MTELQYLWQVTVAGLGTGLLYGLVGIGFAVVFNVSGIINLAQGEFSMLGAMLTLFGINRLGLPLAAAAVLAVVAVTLLGIAFERACISPLKVFSMQSAIIITLGASIFARGGAMVAWGKDHHSLPAFSGQGSVSLVGAAVPLQTLWIVGVTTVVIALLVWWFRSTLFGLAMRSCADNRLGAQFVGINVRLMVTASFAMSATLGAIAGIVAAPLTFVSYDGGLVLGIKGFVAAILGGSGTLSRPGRGRPARRPPGKPERRVPLLDLQGLHRLRPPHPHHVGPAGRAPRPRAMMARRELVAVVGAAALLAAGVSSLFGDSYVLSVLNYIGLFAVAVMGLVIVLGYGGQIVLGHAAFMGLGAYTSAILTHRAGWIRVVAIVVAAALVAGAAWGASASRSCACAASTWRWPPWPSPSSWTRSSSAGPTSPRGRPGSSASRRSRWRASRWSASGRASGSSLCSCSSRSG